MKKWTAIAVTGAIVLTIAIVLAGTALAAGRNGIQEREAGLGWGRGSVNQDEDVDDFRGSCAEGAGCQFADEDGDGLGHICGDEHGEGDCDGGEARGHCSGREGKGEGRGNGEGRGLGSEEGCQLH